MTPRPDYMAAARAELGRRAEERHPGWVISHGLYGWDATRSRDHRTTRSDSLTGLEAIIDVTDRIGMPPGPGPGDDTGASACPDPGPCRDP